MLRRARHHIGDVEREINAFSHDKPWAIVSEKDADGAVNVCKVKFTKRLSEDLPNIVFDGVNNLRSVLDQTAFAIAVRYTKTANPKSAKFPFGPTKSDMLNNLAGGGKDLPPEIRALFRSFNPYKGGNNALWAMNELCNAPKHKLLYPIGLAGGVTTMRPNGLVISGSTPIELHPPRWDREKYELVIARMGAEAQFTGDFDATFTVAFDDVDEVIRGQHPVAVLGIMTREVEQVLNLSEVACKCIGLIK